MGVLTALTVGLMLWVAAWGLGIKSFDAFLVTVAIVVTAAAVRVFAPLLKPRG